jgi:hypothetical protein
MAATKDTKSPQGTGIQFQSRLQQLPMFARVGCLSLLTHRPLDVRQQHAKTHMCAKRMCMTAAGAAGWRGSWRACQDMRGTLGTHKDHLPGQHSTSIG